MKKRSTLAGLRKKQIIEHIKGTGDRMEQQYKQGTTNALKVVAKIRKKKGLAKGG